jgi:hypothetical protein
MYYIYHIKGVKIGCSTEPDVRVTKQGYTDYEVLETHTDIDVVSDRERQLQKQYGYKVDSIPYSTTIKITSKGGKVGGPINLINGTGLFGMSEQEKESCRINGGKVTGNKNAESGRVIDGTSSKRNYGSASLIGKVWSDKVCLDTTARSCVLNFPYFSFQN